MSLSDRDRLIQMAQTIEDVGGATALLQRCDHRYVPHVAREQLTNVRQKLSLLFGELTRELCTIAEDSQKESKTSLPETLTIVRLVLQKAHRARSDAMGWTLDWHLHDKGIEDLALTIASEIVKGEP